MSTKDTAPLPRISGNGYEVAQRQHPPLTSNEDLNGEKSHFSFSPDKKQIAFVQNVFEEFGNDWDKYWALKLFDTETREEKTLLVDDSRMAGYEWRSAATLRVFHSAGTGVRGYRDVSVDLKEPFFFKKDDNGLTQDASFWQADEGYTREAREAQEAREVYFAFSSAPR